ncbi:MAG TPA: dTMP kinase [Bacteroidales bacterium]|nr:dTMP kinase [Bacteroidales bacterium]
MSFINIEGLDGSGKSTQIRHLTQYLEKQNIPCQYIHFPRTDSPIFGELIAKFLRGELGNIESVNPYLVALIYAGDRNDAKKMLYEWINQQYLVIVDRYVYSNIAFQSAKLESMSKTDELSRWIKYLEFEYNGIPRPDHSFFLDVPLEFTRTKLSAKREGSDRQYLKGKQDIHEKSIHFQQQVRTMYLRETEREENFHRIDCQSSEGNMLPPEEIMQKMLPFFSF